MRFGIIGTGRIADRFIKTVKDKKINIDVVICFNPKVESARKFAIKNEIKQYTDTVEELLEKVDCVYVASPHQTHVEYTRKSLLAQKHVLCEKPMALRKQDAMELFEIADRNGCVLFEAIKTSFCPGFLQLLEKARSGCIGEIVDVEATFTRLTDINLREFQDYQYGGSFMEFGSYVMMPALKLLGTDYEHVSFHSIQSSTGVDTYTKIFLYYSNRMAMGKTGLGVKSEGQLLISGTNGYIIAPSPWWMTKKFIIRYEDPNIIEEYNFEYDGSGLQYEIAAFLEEIHNNVKKDIGMKPEESIALAGLFENFLNQRSNE